MHSDKCIILPILIGIILIFLADCGGNPSAPNPQSAAPVIVSLDPAYTITGMPTFEIKAIGNGFTTQSLIEWNGIPITMNTSSSATTVYAIVPESYITNAGTAQISVMNSPGSISNTVAFSIHPAAPGNIGVVELVNVSTDNPNGCNGETAIQPAVSPTGRYVAFQSNATDLVPGPASGYADIYERDTCLGAPAGCQPFTIRVSEATDGTLSNGNSRNSSISADGRFVVFGSSATNLVPNDTQINGLHDVFLRDTCINAPAGCTPSTVRISVMPNGSQAPDGGSFPTITPDGRYIIFGSGSALDPAYNSGGIFVYDTCHGTITSCTPSMHLISVNNSNQTLLSDSPQEIYDPQFIPFIYLSSSSSTAIIMVRNTCIGATSPCTPNTYQATLGNNGQQPNKDLNGDNEPTDSADGRYVAFGTFATNLTSQAITNGQANEFQRDTCEGAPAGCVPSTILITPAYDGGQANLGSGQQTQDASGRYVAFSSLATNLVPNDPDPPGTTEDIFVRDTCLGAPNGCVPTTHWVSVALNGLPSDGVSTWPVITADGHYVAFISDGMNLLMPKQFTDGHNMIFLAKTGF